MTTDVATLQFQVDSSQAASANDHLDTLEKRSRAAEASFRDLHASSMMAGAGMTSFTGSLGMGSMQLGQMAGSLQLVVSNLQATRNALDGLAPSFQNFDRARMQAEGLASALGTGAVAMESFARQSSQFNMTSLETAISLQRVTSAIEGQTAAGRQLRQVMADYGVTLNGVTASSADKVLMQFAEKVRGFAATPGNTQAMQQVMGPLGLDAITTVQNPGYEPPWQRAQRLQAQDMQRDSAASINGYSQQIKQTALDQARVDTLQARFGTNPTSATNNFFQHNNPVGLMEAMYPADSTVYPQDRLQQYRAKTQSADGNLDILQWLAANPKSEFARDRRGWFGNQQDDYAASPAGQYWAGKDQPAFNAMDVAAQARFDKSKLDSSTGGGGWGDMWLGRNWHYLQDTIGERAGARFVQPAIPAPPEGPYKPLSQTDLDKAPEADGGLLSGFGVNGVQNRFAATRQLRGLTLGGDVSDVRAALGRSYKPDVADTMNANLLANARHAQDIALTPGGAELDTQAEQRWLQNVPAEQRGQARQLLSVAKANNVATSRWSSGQGMSFGSLMSGGSGAGALTQGQRDAAGKLQSGDDGLFADKTRESTQNELDLQIRLRGALADGAAAVQSLTAYWQTYNTVLEQGRGIEQAKTAGLAAQTKAMAANRTEGQRLLTEMHQQNVQDDVQLSALRQAGTDPAARQRALTLGPIDAATAKFQREHPESDAAGYRAEQLRAASRTAGAAGNEMLIQQAEATSRQRDTTSTAGMQQATQQALNNELSTERDFRTQLAALSATGSAAQVAALRAEMEQVTALKNEYDLLKQTQENRDFARDRDQDADFNQSLIGKDGDQQRTMRRAYEVIKRNRGNPELFPADPNKPAAPLTREDLLRGGFENEETDPRYPNPDPGAGNPLLSGGGTMSGGRAPHDPSGGGSRRSPLGERTDSNNAFTAGLRNNEKAGRSEEAVQNDADDKAYSYAQRQARARQGAFGRGSGSLGADLAGALVQGSEVNHAENAARRLATVVDNLNTKFAEQRAGMADTAKAAVGLSEAWGQGRQAGEAFERHLGNNQEIARLQALSPAEQLRVGAAGKIAELTGNNAGLDRNAAIGKGTDFRKQQLGFNDQNELLGAEIDAGPFASAQRLASARSGVLTNQFLRTGATKSDGSLFSEGEVKATFDANEKMKVLAADTALVRNNFVQFGNAAMQGFENAAVGGERLRNVMHSLAQDLEKMLLKSFVEAPLMKLFSQGADAGMSGASGLIGKLFGAGGAAAGGGAVAGSAGSLAVGATESVAFVAQGGVLPQGARSFYSQGGLLDHPTTFYANGGTVVGGEQDTEAVMPLKRLPNGNLGISAQGGGGGHTIVVNSPITIQGGGGGAKGGGMDAASQKALSKQFEQMHTQAVRAVLANEMRNGGDLTSMNRKWS